LSLDQHGKVNWHCDQLKELGWTFSAWQPKSRIDYTLLRGVRAEFISVEGNISEIQIGISPVGGILDMNDRLYPSDHKFVFSKIVNDEQNMT